MADAALAGFHPRKEHPYEPLTRLGLAACRQMMPMREDLPPAPEGYEEVKKKAMSAYKQALAANAPVHTIKKLAEAYNRAHWMPDIVKWYDLTPQDLADRQSPYELNAFCLNNVYFVGVPGETVMATNDYLRSNSYGAKLVTMTECNGDLGYIATREQYPFGSYEVNCGMQHISGEQRLREAALELILRA